MAAIASTTGITRGETQTSCLPAAFKMAELPVLSMPIWSCIIVGIGYAFYFKAAVRRF